MVPTATLAKALGSCRLMFVVEEAHEGSGIKEALAWEINRFVPDCRIDGIDLGGNFACHGDIPSLHKHYGLDATSIASRIKEVVQNEN